jgi:tetratricopeptide (TPR) repeat protein
MTMANLCASANARKRTDVGFAAVSCLALFLVAGWQFGTFSFGDEKAAKKGSKSSSKAKAAAKAEVEEEPVDESELETDDDLTALVVPPSLLGTTKSMDRMKFSQELRGLLAEGMGVDGDSQAAAKRHFEASHRLVPDDPRAAYAYGLALLAQQKTRESLDQFRAAAQNLKAPFLPALQAIAWVSVSRNDFSRGLPAVLDLARKIEESKGTWPTEHDRTHSAEWLGRMMGFLAGPGQPADQSSQIAELEGDVEKLLTGECKEAYGQGRKFVATRHENLKALVARPADEMLAELKKKRQELVEAAQAANVEVKQLEDEIREIKGPHDKQIADFNRERRSAGQKAKKASHDIAVVEEQVEALSQPQMMPQTSYVWRYRARVPVTTVRAENAAERKAREGQLASARQRLQSAQSSLDQAKQEMSDLKSQIEQASAEYRKAVAEKRPLLTAARRKAQDLTARARDAERGLASPEKLKSRLTALESYVPLDPETEKNRLLATLKTSG